jgi:hypothetical protein
VQIYAFFAVADTAYPAFSINMFIDREIFSPETPESSSLDDVGFDLVRTEKI